MRKEKKNRLGNRFCVDFMCINSLIKNCVLFYFCKSCVFFRVEF